MHSFMLAKFQLRSVLYGRVQVNGVNGLNLLMVLHEWKIIHEDG